MYATNQAPTAPQQRPAPPRPTLGPPGLLALLASTVVASLLVWQVVRHTLVDDAFIYLSYARTLADDGTWGMIPGLESNTATSALFALTMAALTWLVGDALVAAGVLFVASFTLLGWGLHRLGRAMAVAPAFAWLATGLVLVNPLLLSSSGLEVHLATALIVWSAVAAAEGRTVAFGLFSGALFLTRPDLVVYAGAFVLVAPRLLRRAHVAAVAAACVVLPWLVFSWLTLGSIVPDTLVIKLGQGSWGPWTFSNGLGLYYAAYPLATAASLVGPLLGLVGALVLAVASRGLATRGIDTRPAVGLGLGAVAYFAAYGLLGVPPYHWYYATSLAALSVVFAAGVCALAVVGGRRSAQTAAAALAMVPVLLGSASLIDVAERLPDGASAITTNWATPADYKRIGTELGQWVDDEAVQSPGEIGALAYYCECTVVDDFSDRARAAALVDDRVTGAAASWPGQLLRLNYLHLERGRDPLPAPLVMEWRPGPDPGDGDATVLETWTSESPWRGDGHFVLRRP